MSKRAAIIFLAALALMFCLTGCGGSSSSTPVTPATGTGTPASMKFAKGVTMPGVFSNGTPGGVLIGFDISYVDPTLRKYYLGAAQFAGVLSLDIDTVPNASTTVSLIAPAAPNNFSGSIHDSAGNQQFVDPFSDFAGGPLGVITVDHKEIWAGDSNTYNGGSSLYPGEDVAIAQNDCNSSVKVINATTQAAQTIYTNGCEGSDELAYDSDHHLVLVGNPDEFSLDAPNRKAGVPAWPFISLISTQTYQVVKQIAFDGTGNTPVVLPSDMHGGGIEQPVYSPATGMFYVSVPSDESNGGDGAIAIIDPVNKVGAGTIPLSNCSPSGMALGPDNKEVFLACNNGPVYFPPPGAPGGPQVVSLVDDTTAGVHVGDVLAYIPDAINPNPAAGFAASCDEANYNPSLNVYMAACNFSYDTASFAVVSAGTGLDASKIKFITNVSTNPAGESSLGAAHSIASDPVTGAVFVPLPFGGHGASANGDPLCYLTLGCIGVFAPSDSGFMKKLEKAYQ